MDEFFKNLHKWKGKTFGTQTQTSKKAEDLNKHRRETRNKMMNMRRNIDENVNNIYTPDINMHKKTERVLRKETAQHVPGKRLEMLAKWKEEKEKQKQVKKSSAKPVFKVCHIPVNVGLPNLENVNKEIKGKPIKNSKFAPVNHKFTAPANVKPINFEIQQKPSIRSKAALVRMKELKSQTLAKSTSTQVKETSTSGEQVNKKVEPTANITSNAQIRFPLRKLKKVSIIDITDSPDVVKPTLRKTPYQKKVVTKVTPKKNRATSRLNLNDSTTSIISVPDSPISDISNDREASITGPGLNETFEIPNDDCKSKVQTPLISTKTSKKRSSDQITSDQHNRTPNQVKKKAKTIGAKTPTMKSKGNDVRLSKSSDNVFNQRQGKANDRSATPRVILKQMTDVEQRSTKSSRSRARSATPNRKSEKETPKAEASTHQTFSSKAQRTHEVQALEVHLQQMNVNSPSTRKSKKSEQVTEITNIKHTPRRVSKYSTLSGHNTPSRSKKNEKIETPKASQYAAHKDKGETNDLTKTPRRSRRIIEENTDITQAQSVKSNSSTRNTPNTRKSANKRNKVTNEKVDENQDSKSGESSDKPTSNSTDSSCSTDYPLEDNFDVVDASGEKARPKSYSTPNIKTPDNRANRESSPVYISPFVTISRGKDSARKEYRVRLSSGGSLPALEINRATPNHTSPKAGAVYFTKVVNNEVDRITQMCQKWEKYKEEEAPCESACDMINTAIGQSNLLMTKKFQQFRSYITQCDSEDAEKPVTCADLHGFWEVIYMQVQDVDKRFEYLETLKRNNWEEIMEEKKKPVAKKRGRPQRKAAAAATSSLRDAIKAARRKKNETSTIQVPVVEVEVATFDGGFFVVKSPKGIAPPARKTPRKSVRKSLLATVLTQEINRRSSMSPGLTMMKASQTAKLTEGMTPGKSILKSNSNRSTIKLNKSVLFNDAVQIDDGDANLENNQNSVNLIDFTPPEATPSKRTSQRIRLSRNKLF